MKIAIGKKVRNQPYPKIYGYETIDVSSGSARKLNGIPVRELSPLLIRTGDDCPGGPNIIFEDLWQFSKVYPNLGHLGNDGLPNEIWKSWNNENLNRSRLKEKGDRTPKEVANLKRKFKNGKIDSWTPQYSFWENRPLTYIESRKRLYAPEYQKCIQRKDILNHFPKTSLLLIGPDGPEQPMELNLENIQLVINDPNHIFDHSWIIGATLLGIDYHSYTS